MTTLYHPRIPGMTVEVEDADVDAHSDAGWLKSDPNARKPRTSTKSGEDNQ